MRATTHAADVRLPHLKPALTTGGLSQRVGSAATVADSVTAARKGKENISNGESFHNCLQLSSSFLSH